MQQNIIGKMRSSQTLEQKKPYVECPHYATTTYIIATNAYTTTTTYIIIA